MGRPIWKHHGRLATQKWRILQSLIDNWTIIVVKPILDTLDTHVRKGMKLQEICLRNDRLYGYIVTLGKLPIPYHFPPTSPPTWNQPSSHFFRFVGRWKRFLTATPGGDQILGIWLGTRSRIWPWEYGKGVDAEYLGVQRWFLDARCVSQHWKHIKMGWWWRWRFHDRWVNLEKFYVWITLMHFLICFWEVSRVKFPALFGFFFGFTWHHDISKDSWHI